MKYFKLYNDIKIPSIGFGTWQIKDGEEAYSSTLYALNNGYRHIDTAYAYENEKSIAKAIKDSKIDRKELFITTKLPSHIKTYDETIKYFNESLSNLGLDYIDLYLIHAPWPWSNIGQDCSEGNIEAWKAFINLYNKGKIKAIGVSNFSISDIENLIKATGIKPMVNQIRYFIGNRQNELVKYCQTNNILVEAYSPFATGNILQNENIANIAKKYNTTVNKICLQFCLQNNTLPLPKSIHEDRIKDNIDLNINISNEDMEYLNSLTEESLKKPYRS